MKSTPVARLVRDAESPLDAARLPVRAAPIARLRAFLAAVAIGVAGCDLTVVEILPSGDLVTAGVTVVVTVDPADPSRIETRMLARLTRGRDVFDNLVPGASVWITGESGRSIELVEEADPRSACATPLPKAIAERRGDDARLPIGSCYTVTTSSAYFAPGEQLSLTITMADGETLQGVTRIPGAFAPSGLSVNGGRCRMEPGTNYRFAWPPAEAAWAYIGEAEITGLSPELWPRDDALHLPVTSIGDQTGMMFPRDFLFEVIDIREGSLYRTLHAGLPEGAAADIAIGAVDRNWTNWVRPGRLLPQGEVRVPSVFGDGTGMFGAAVRWKVSVESRHAEGEGDLPLCGPKVVE